MSDIIDTELEAMRGEIARLRAELAQERESAMEWERAADIADAELRSCGKDCQVEFNIKDAEIARLRTDKEMLLEALGKVVKHMNANGMGQWKTCEFARTAIARATEGQK